MNANPADIDAYLTALPGDQRAALEKLRGTIRAAAPEAVESISYGMPTFKHRGRPLIYFGAAKNHCAIYGPAVDAFRDELAAYDASKGTIRFQPGKPLPAALVKKLLRARIAEIEAAAAGPKRTRTSARMSR
jgi:uncharacterized protein YdhG (YjbR/CyaY superfamily)